MDPSGSSKRTDDANASIDACKDERLERHVLKKSLVQVLNVSSAGTRIMFNSFSSEIITRGETLTRLG